MYCASHMTLRIRTCTLFSPSFSRFVTLKACGMNMFDVSPIFSPFKNTSASVSIPSNTSITRCPSETLGFRNVLV